MLIITGSIAYDYIMEFPGAFGEHILPDQIHHVNLSFIVNKFAKRRGGTAGNASYTLGLLSTPHILFSFVGKDFNDYKKTFKKMGIDTSFVKVDKNDYTATGFAMTDKSQNQIWGFYYGAAIRNQELQLDEVLTKEKEANLVVIGPQGAIGSMSFVKQCIAVAIPYMFDPGFILTQVSDEDLRLGLQHATYVIGNEYEINLMKERMSDFNKITEGKIVITTLGGKGTLINDRGTIYIIPVVSVANVISTTGAGDAWRGGFLAGLMRRYDMQVCGQMGAVASSFAVEHFGTQEHLYTKREFQKRYRQSFNTLVEL